MFRIDRWWSTSILALTCTVVGCRAAAVDPATLLEGKTLLADLTRLASDEFEGRAPGSAGEQKTVEFLTAAFKAAGLAPGNPDGTYAQAVPLVGITADRNQTLTITKGSQTLTLKPLTDFVAFTKRVVDHADIDAEMVFVGYGATAPEYDWDDIKGMDLKGKVLIFLVNDPPGSDIFGGRAMTYYGRWTYKFEQAARLGAAGAFIVHDTEPAGYPWEVVTGSWTGEQFDLATPDKNMGRASVEGWLHLNQAGAIFSLAGLDLAAQREAARDRSFKPVPLGVTARLAFANSLRTVDSLNVVGRLMGTEAPDEHVVLMGHWDHLGRDSSLTGDQIYNGAQDNASGTAALIAIARAFKDAHVTPRRSLLFLAVTAEEQGLLGSRYYAEHPLYPADSTVAAINMDALNMSGRTRDITVVGMGQSTLDSLAAKHAAAQNRTLRADPEPEKGFYYRSDHFEFAKVGVPAFYAEGGIDAVGHPEGWGLAQRKDYTDNRYHKPADEVQQSWDLSGVIEDLQLLTRMAHELASGREWPEWSRTSEFRALREAQRRGAQP